MIKFMVNTQSVNPLPLIFCLFFLISCNPDKAGKMENTATLEIKKPEWIKEGIVAGGSNHEPFIFYLRRGRMTHKTEQDYLNTHTDESIEKLIEQGATFYMTHAFKGFGLEAEKPEIELAKDFASRLHKKGLKVGTYIGSSLVYETFLLEVPEAEEWLVPDYLGKPVYYHDQFFRRRPYFMHPGYRNYIKKVIKIAINEIGSDLIHFDNQIGRAHV